MAHKATLLVQNRFLAKSFVKMKYVRSKKLKLWTGVFPSFPMFSTIWCEKELVNSSLREMKFNPGEVTMWGDKPSMWLFTVGQWKITWCVPFIRGLFSKKVKRRHTGLSGLVSSCWTARNWVVLKGIEFFYKLSTIQGCQYCQLRVSSAIRQELD